MIKFVFLDLDDTLLDFQKAEAVALEKTMQQFSLPFSKDIAERYNAINAAQWELLEKGALTRDEVRLRRFVLLLELLGERRDADAVRQCYESNLSIGHFFMSGAEELLAALHGKYHLFIASNGTVAVQNGRMQSANIAHFFEEIFLSEQIGVAKPQKAFFDHCFAQISEFDPAQAIIVGDSLTSDILGGIHAGIKTCWYNPRGKAGKEGIVPDCEIKRLCELPALLETL